MSEVLACVDFSDATDGVIREAARLAHLTGDRLHLLHVAMGEPEIAGYDRGPVAAHSRDDRAHELLDEHQQLRAIADRLGEQGVTATPLVVMGSTVETILAEAERLEASHVVVGSHGHGALHHLLLGSISEGVVRACRRPVVVVPVGQR